MAFDKGTGKRLWSSQYVGPAGHSGGLVPMQVGPVDCLAVLGLRDLAVLRLDRGNEGRTLATFKWQSMYGCNIPTPAVAGNRVVLTSGYNRMHTVLVEVSPGGARQVWVSRPSATVSSPLVLGSHVYVMDGPLYCLNLADGHLIWHGGSFGNGSCLATADGKIIAFGNGRLALLDAAARRTEYRKLSELDNVVPGTCYPHVALSEGIVCVKDREGKMVCYSVAGAADARGPGGGASRRAEHSDR
jgi:outer membrane protein assembly factor BamB